MPWRLGWAKDVLGKANKNVIIRMRRMGKRFCIYTPLEVGSRQLLWTPLPKYCLPVWAVASSTTGAISWTITTATETTTITRGIATAADISGAKAPFR